MYRASAELASASLGLFNKEMSAEYEHVNKLLLANLTAQEATIDQLAQQHENDRGNALLLKIFTGLLPVAVHIPREGWRFKTDDPVLARVIQSHVVWVREAAGGWHVKPDDEHRESRKWFEETTTYGQRPYFVLGNGSEGARTTWLLGCVGANDDRYMRFNPYTWMEPGVKKRDGKPFFFSPGWVSRRILKNHVQVSRSEFPSPDDMRHMYDPGSRQLHVDENSPRSTQLPKHKHHEPQPVDKISDYMLGLLGVTSYLESIATELKLVPSLKRLYETYSSEPTKS